MTSYSLNQMLNTYTMDVLKAYAKIHDLSGYSKLKKNELVEMVEDAVLNTMEDALIWATQDEIELFEKAMNQVVFVEDIMEEPKYIFWDTNLLLYQLPNSQVVVPEEVQANYHLIMKHKEYQKYQNDIQLVDQYARACTNLYQIVELEELVKIFNSQNETQVDIDEIRMLMTKRFRYRFYREYFKHDNYLLNEDFSQDGPEMEYAHDLLKAQSDKPYYVPKQEELLKYVDEDYFEKTLYFEALNDFLMTKFKMEKEQAYECADDIQCMVRFGAGFEEIIETLEEYDVEISSEKLVSHFVKTVINLCNHSRLPDNRGYTPEELSKFRPDSVEMSKEEMDKMANMDLDKEEDVIPFPTTVVKEKKIYPNDPCPCGSGKKYKKCCGRNK